MKLLARVTSFVMHTPRFTYWDLIVFWCSLFYVGGWTGLMILIVLMFAGDFIGGFAKAAYNDLKQESTK
jgi:hypothetical protein